MFNSICKRINDIEFTNNPFFMMMRKGNEPKITGTYSHGGNLYYKNYNEYRDLMMISLEVTYHKEKINFFTIGITDGLKRLNPLKDFSSIPECSKLNSIFKDAGLPIEFRVSNQKIVPIFSDDIIYISLCVDDNTYNKEKFPTIESVVDYLYDNNFIVEEKPIGLSKIKKYIDHFKDPNENNILFITRCFDLYCLRFIIHLDMDDICYLYDIPIDDLNEITIDFVSLVLSENRIYSTNADLIRRIVFHYTSENTKNLLKYYINSSLHPNAEILYNENGYYLKREDDDSVS
jgi:hypothetical protein